MVMWKYTFFLITFILSNYSFADQNDEEKAAMKYVAHEDTSIFLEQMETFGEEYGKSWIVFPDGNGTAQFAVLHKDRTGSLGKTVTTKWTLKDVFNHVHLYLYTSAHPEGEELDVKNLNSSQFDPAKTTKIICHGWMASSDSSVITAIRDAYLEKQDVNVIGVDWSYIAKDYIYPNAAAATTVVGKFIGTVINSLVDETGTEYKNFHIIGHSLGAHTAGFAGSYTKQKIGRITGLDPALPGFQYIKGPNERLDSEDAEFVDIIHTCAGVLGMSILAGHADFYPNGGSPFQPGCCLQKFPTGTQACSHSRSHEFFAESIRYSEFKAVKCKDWDHFKKNQCEEKYADMGENASTKARGAYYLKTAMNPPFALGLIGTNY